MNRRAGRSVLLAVVALHLVADNALSPFYPQLFRALFGITDLSATGTYVWACRAAAVAALPLWGLAARRFAAHHLVIAGLLASTVLDVALAFAPTYLSFLLLSVALVGTTMAMALAYPALVALGDNEDRLPQVRAFAVVTHLATIAATLVGAGVMALPNVRWGIAAFAVLDLALAWACYRMLGKARPTPESRPAAVKPALKTLAFVAAIVLAAEIGRNVVRPFFTSYVEQAGLAPLTAAVLFLAPSLAALAVLAGAGSVYRRLGGALLPAAFALAAGGLAVQAASADLPALVAGRLLFGAGLGLGQIALDLRIFAATGTSGPAFAAVQTVRTVGLLASPILATAAATVALPGPLLLGAAVFAVPAALLTAALLTADRRTPPAPGPVSDKETRVPESVR